MLLQSLELRNGSRSRPTIGITFTGERLVHDEPQCGNGDSHRFGHCQLRLPCHHPALHHRPGSPVDHHGRRDLVAAAHRGRSGRGGRIGCDPRNPVARTVRELRLRDRRRSQQHRSARHAEGADCQGLHQREGSALPGARGGLKPAVNAPVSKRRHKERQIPQGLPFHISTHIFAILALSRV